MRKDFEDLMLDIAFGDGENYENEIVPLVDGEDTTQTREVKTGDSLNVLPLRNMVLFPGVLLPVTLSRPKSMKLVEKAYKSEEIIGVFNAKDKEKKEDDKSVIEDDIYPIGAAARVLRIFEMPDGSMMAILEATQRIWMEEYVGLRPYLRVQVRVEQEIVPAKNDKNFLALASTIKEHALFVMEHTPNLPQEAKLVIKNINTADTLINYICVNLNISVDDKRKLLLVNDMRQRGELLLEYLLKEVDMVKTRTDIQEKAVEKINKDQREYYLHRQLEAIQNELGETDDERLVELKERAEQKHWPEHAKAAFEQAIKKVERESPHSSDYQMDITYIETLLDLPWNDCTEDSYDIRQAKEILDKDHYGMDKVKERILEYLAVLKQTHSAKNNDTKAPILCLYGPPGVGKTSLGKSVAKALGRKYARISLGGLHDEAEIRGHRKTYIGAMPGRIINSIKKVQSSNPVFVLDEIDKVGADYKGDPTSALLEVLDPEQNSAFHDNYLDIDYDLSKVLFVATANSLETIPRPLLDRMELIEMTGYLQEEKEEIAKRHLIPKCLKNNGLKASELKISKRIMGEIIDHYTRESGVRSLERQIATICRKVVTKIALEEEYNRSLTHEDVEAYLGKPRFNRDMWENNKYYGVVTGLAWTSVGGEILFIETSLSKSKTPALTLTGNLGDVMKESATIALGYIKAHAEHFGIAQKDIETHSVHLHVPEGAIPKDGPSAGITMTTAMVSAFTKRKVRPRIAMTGEMTLRGKVLPIGGVKEKILAAKRSGITDIVLCEDNRKDVDEIPEMYVKGLTFHYVRDIDEVIDFALLKK